MPRTFNGTSSDKITLSLGATGIAFGPATVAALVKRSADAATHFVFQAGVSTGARYALRITSGNALGVFLNSNGFVAPVGISACVAADGWLLIAVTKPLSAATPPRFHRYAFGTGVWQHVDGGSNASPSNAPITNAFIGGDHSTTSPFAGDIEQCGVWNVVLTDAQIETLAFGLSAWNAVAPKGLWRLNQYTTAQSVVDLSGGGAAQSALAGTTVSSAIPPWLENDLTPMRNTQAMQRAAFR